MCRAIAFNESQELLRVEMLHDDSSAAHMNCQRDCCQRRRVINRRRLKVDRAFAETPCFLKKIVDREVLGRRLVWQWTQNALWPASGAGGIKHCGPESLVGDWRVWDSGRRLVYIANEDAISVAVSDQAQPDIWASLQCRQRHRALCPRRDEDFAFAVVDDVSDLVGSQVGVDAGVIKAGTFAGGAALGITDVVFHEDRKVVEPAEAVRPQQMRQPVAPPLQFAIGQCFAAAGHDYGRLIRPQPRMFAGVHRTSSCWLLSGRTATVRRCIRNRGRVNGVEPGQRSAVTKWVCSRRSKNPSLKRPGGPVAPE